MKVVGGREPSCVVAASSGLPLFLIPEVVLFICCSVSACLFALLDRDSVFCPCILMPVQDMKCIMAINMLLNECAFLGLKGIGSWLSHFYLVAFEPLNSAVLLHGMAPPPENVVILALIHVSLSLGSVA